MNIFCLDKDPRLAAQYHCSRHSIKMVLESVQILSTVHRVLDGKQTIAKSKTGRNVKRWVLDDPTVDSFIYTATHVSHPSVVWARDNIAQYLWLAQLTKELCIEYTYRYGKVHKCEQIGLVEWFLCNIPKNIKTSGFTFTYPTPAMPDDCKVPGDVVTSYRKYYMNHKQRMLQWDGKVNSREAPYWINDKSLLLVTEEKNEEVVEYV